MGGLFLAPGGAAGSVGGGFSLPNTAWPGASPTGGVSGMGTIATPMTVGTTNTSVTPQRNIGTIASPYRVPQVSPPTPERSPMMSTMTMSNPQLQEPFSVNKMQLQGDYTPAEMKEWNRLLKMYGR